MFLILSIKLLFHFVDFEMYHMPVTNCKLQPFCFLLRTRLIFLMYYGLLLQTDIQTHVSTRDVVECFQKQMNPTSYPSTFTNQKLSPTSGPDHNHLLSSNTIPRRGDKNHEIGTEAVAKHMELHPDPGQVGGNV